MKQILIFFTIILISVTSSYAQPGTPDKNFGVDGRILDTGLWADCRGMAIQPDGKILTGGLTDIGNNSTGSGLYIARFSADGNIDENFGVNGKFIVTSIKGANPVYAQAFAVLPDNKILACGRFVTNSPYGGVGLLRLFPDGKIDSSFGINGFVTTRLSHWNDIIGGMAVQQDGRIIVTGNKQSAFSQSGQDFVLRYNTDGSTDQSFGINGLVYTNYESNIIPGAVKIQPDGKIVTGDIYGSSTKQFQLVRYNNDGSLDESFGNAGIARLAPIVGYFSHLNDIVIQDDGKIIVTGAYPGAMALARFESNGQVDVGFGNFNGYTYFYTPGTVAEAKNVFVTTEKKIIITGSYFNENDKVAVVQYNENGTVDSLFGENGLATGGLENMKFGADITSGEGAFQPDGKIIVSGSFLQNDGDTYNVALFRYNGENDKRSKFVKIKKWLHHHGFTWEDRPDNVKYYSVQSSNNGNAFNEIARIVNRGSAAQHFEDASPASGTSYYRVAAVSANNVTSYSNVIAIENSNVQVKVFPNPAKNVLQVAGLPATVKTKLSIADVNGTTRMVTVANSNLFSWNIGQLPKGNYVLHVQYGNTNISRKFIKE